jgi:hypothetical protein
MKSSKLFSVHFFFFIFFMIGCKQNDLEDDAKKLAQLQCQATRIASNSTAGDMSVVSESVRLTAEASKLTRNMQKKYNGTQDMIRFTEIYNRELVNCRSASNGSKRLQNIKNLIVQKVNLNNPEQNDKSEPQSDCNKFLDDYEKLIDNYVYILEKYKSNPTDVLIINEYTRLSSEVGEWADNTPDCTDPLFIDRLTKIQAKIAGVAASYY